MPRKLLFFDIDGTLIIHPDEVIPESTEAAIRRTREMGNLCFICTGRAPYMLELAGRLEMDGYIFSNGACAILGDEVIVSEPIPPGLVSYVRQLADRCGAGYSLQSRCGGWMSPRQKEHFLRMNRGLPPETVKRMENSPFMRLGGHPIAEYQGEEVYKIDISFEETSDAELFRKWMDPRLNYIGMLSTSGNGRNGGEITLKHVTKGTTANRIVQWFGGEIEDSYGFGDSLNDMDLIRRCGIGIAMGNAVEELKKAADYVTTDIRQDGIANAMKHFHLV